MDRRMDGQTDKVKPVYPPFNCIEVGGIIISFIIPQSNYEAIANTTEYLKKHQSIHST